MNTPHFNENLFLAFGLPGHGELVVLVLLGLLIFGRRLPEVGRSIGRSIVEFKKGIKGIEDDIDDASTNPRPAVSDSSSQQLPPDRPASATPESSATDTH